MYNGKSCITLLYTQARYGWMAELKQFEGSFSVKLLHSVFFSETIHTHIFFSDSVHMYSI